MTNPLESRSGYNWSSLHLGVGLKTVSVLREINNFGLGLGLGQNFVGLG